MISSASLGSELQYELCYLSAGEAEALQGGPPCLFRMRAAYTQRRGYYVYCPSNARVSRRETTREFVSERDVPLCLAAVHVCVPCDTPAPVVGPSELKDEDSLATPVVCEPVGPLLEKPSC